MELAASGSSGDFVPKVRANRETTEKMMYIISGGDTHAPSLIYILSRRCLMDR
jgi:hypothetical protein